ncbi:GNAT family N-acetyltransferase [Nocardioides sp. GXQ0305]|uniref:bifunctional acetate--CoA ligase family protein/GNAT family N-acetyltransferase n=1 Tax=Nocardioides sp. GXQ0305 TaxID=3423912 RepID=UPI003D7D4AA8
MDPATRPRPADVLMSDGRIASIRPLAASDRAELGRIHDDASDDTIWLRFFAVDRTSAHRYVDHLFTAPSGVVTTLVATVADHIVGVATAEHLDARTAEVAFLVADREQGHGLGSLLLEHLAAACRDRGVRRFVAEVLTQNAGMVRVFLDAGFDLTRSTEHGVVTVEMSTQATARAIEAADGRECASEARSLAPLLLPASVAVVGVRRDGTGLGHAVLRSIVEGGFTGELSVVHPHLEEIDGVRAYRTLGDVPGHVDLAVVAVPAARVLAAIEDAAAAGTSAAVVISSGLAELGPEGAEVQRQALRVARAHDMRLVGPNCLGLMCNDPAIRLNATFTDSVPSPGGLAVASQSGGVGIALLDVARERGVGVRTFVSLGNKADVSGNDLLCAWLEDPDVTAAALYLESFGNARKFARLARRFSARKPLMAVVGGRSTSGRRAGASHTAAAASPAVGVDALFSQAGVIACQSAEAISRAALLLDQQPLPAGRRLGIVTNAGGLGVLAADSADSTGLLVPELSEAVRHELAHHVNVTTGTSNPVDLGAGAGADHLTGVVDVLLASGEVDALLAVLVPTTVAPARPLVEALAAVRTRCPATPVVLVGLGGLGEGAGDVTVYHAVDHALEALDHAARYAEWRRTPASEPPAPDLDRAERARATAARLVAASEDPVHWLHPADVDDLLTPYGLGPVGTLAADARTAGEVAAGLGFPVVVKVADPAVLHKTDRGLVRVGLRTADDVARAAREFAVELGSEEVPVLVQPVVSGVEIALGVARDPTFGPLVMVAAGGVATGVLDDRVFLMPPFSRQDAARAIRSLRSWPLLDGYRGAPRVDLASLEDLLLGLGELSGDVPQLAELDLNPVMCRPDGTIVVDAKVGLGDTADTDEGVPRRLRGPA